jgi:membrane associated rhomboid family serine protease
LFPLKDNIPTRRFPVLTVLIIAINVVMYFGFQEGGLGLPDDQAKTVEYGAIPYEIAHPGDECDLGRDALGREQILCEGQPGVAGEAEDQPPTWLTILTSMFMHGSILHLGGNMLFMWIFGNNIEDSMGRLRFVAFYLLGGVVALLAQTALDVDAAVPTIGASGAVAAVLGAYALLYPRARVITLILIIIFFTIVELPALLVLGAWFLLQVLYGSAELTQPVTGGGGVAYFAHIGGFLFGLLLIKLFADKVHEDYERPQRLAVY